MKMRTTCLAALPALTLPLMSCMRSSYESPNAPGTLAATAATSQGAAAGLPAKDWAPMGPATFPHDRHVAEFEIECATCHHETNAQPLSIPHPDYFDDLWIDCSICHHKAGAVALESQACSTCHHPQNGDIADETLSAKVVIHKNCWSCHEVGTGAAASATCKTCHTPGS